MAAFREDLLDQRLDAGKEAGVNPPEDFVAPQAQRCVAEKCFQPEQGECRRFTCFSISRCHSSGENSILAHSMEAPEKRQATDALLKRAIVTGASRGIGRAIAAVLAGNGYEVIGTSRDPGAMPPDQRIPGVRYMSLDLQSEKSIEAFLANAGDVEVLINNAATNFIGPVGELPLGKIRALFDANLFGLIRLTQGIVASMRERRSGTVINVASFAGIFPVPFISPYAASKSALIAISRGLRQEVAPWGVRVVVVAPFHINTTLPLEIACGENSVYLPMVRKVKVVRDRNLAEAPGPELVAKKVLRILSARTPRFFNVVGRGAGITAFLVKHLPDRVVERLARKRAGLPAFPKSVH